MSEIRTKLIPAVKLSERDRATSMTALRTRPRLHCSGRECTSVKEYGGVTTPRAILRPPAIASLIPSFL